MKSRLWINWVAASFFSISLLGACGTELPHLNGAAGQWTASLSSLRFDNDQTWRGGLIGGALSEPLTIKTAEMILRTGREAARQGKPVAYQTVNGRQRIEAFPLRPELKTDCPSIRMQVFQDGKLFQEEVRTVCP